MPANLKHVFLWTETCSEKSWKCDIGHCLFGKQHALHPLNWSMVMWYFFVSPALRNQNLAHHEGHTVHRIHMLKLQPDHRRLSIIETSQQQIAFFFQKIMLIAFPIVGNIETEFLFIAVNNISSSNAQLGGAAAFPKLITFPEIMQRLECIKFYAKIYLRHFVSTRQKTRLVAYGIIWLTDSVMLLIDLSTTSSMTQPTIQVWQRPINALVAVRHISCAARSSIIRFPMLL